MHENEWTKQKLIPLLRLLGYHSVHFTGGAAEMGRDVVFADYDRFAILRYFAAQVKAGDVRASGPDRQLAGIVDQLKIAYDTSYTEPSNGRKYLMSGVYLIASGTISDYAKQYFKEKTGQWLHIVDGDGLDTARSAASTRVSDGERAGRIALLSTDLECRILPVTASVTTTVVSPPEIIFGANALSTLAVEKYIDIAIVELDPSDIALLIALNNVLAAFNGMFLKIPIGRTDQSVFPTLEGYRTVACKTKEAALNCKRLLEYVLKFPRPEPGSRLPSSGIGGHGTTSIPEALEDD